MKQIITPSQLRGLTIEQQNKLREWWQPQAGDVVISNSSAIDLGFTRRHDLCFLVVQVFLRDYNGDDIPGKDITLRVYDEKAKNPYFQKTNCLPLLSVGQCVDLIGRPDSALILEYYQYDDELEIIDKLWGKVKEIL